MAFGYIGKAANQTQAAKKGVYSIKEHFSSQPEIDGVPEDGVPVQYVIIGGGGGGGHGYFGNKTGGGGGAGGYLSNVYGEQTGGETNTNSGTMPIFYATVGTNYDVSVGAGGAGNGGNTSEFAGGSKGTDTYFETITAVGGNPSGGHASRASFRFGGSASGGVDGQTTGVGAVNTKRQGNLGGNAAASNYASGAGGGAGAVGGNASGHTAGVGGNGLSSSITGTPTTRAGGGGGASNNTTGGAGGAGGGGNGSQGGATSQSGTANTGGGAGGGGALATSGSGGSGVVIFRYPKEFTITTNTLTVGAETTIGEEKYIEITGGTDTVSWSRA